MRVYTKAMRRLFTHKKVFLMLGIALLLIGVGIGTLMYLRQQERNSYPDRFPYSCSKVETISPTCAVIEDLGKLKVSRRPEVLDLVKKFGSKGVQIKALEFERIQDKAFLKQLLGKNYVELGCIIVAQYSGGENVYLDDDKLEVIKQLDGREFHDWLAGASAENRKLYFDSLH